MRTGKSGEKREGKTKRREKEKRKSSTHPTRNHFPVEKSREADLGEDMERKCRVGMPILDRKGPRGIELQFCNMKGLGRCLPTLWVHLTPLTCIFRNG